MQAETADDLASATETTAWGPARRLKPPLTVAETPMRWDKPAGRLRSREAVWAEG